MTAVDPADALFQAFLRSCPLVPDEAAAGPPRRDNYFPDTGATTHHDRQTQACDALDAFLQRMGAQCIDYPPTDAGGAARGLYTSSRYYSAAQAAAAAGSPERAMMDRLAGVFALLQTCAAVRLHRTCVETWCREIAKFEAAGSPAAFAFSLFADPSPQDHSQRAVRALHLHVALPGTSAGTPAAAAEAMLNMWHYCQVRATFGTSEGGCNTQFTTVEFGGIRAGQQPPAASGAGSGFGAPAALLLAATMRGDRNGDHMLWRRAPLAGMGSQQAARDFQGALRLPCFVFKHQW